MGKANRLKSIGFFMVCSLASCMLSVLVSCANGDEQPIITPEEAILVGCDTFSLTSNLRAGDYIYTTPDSFLLGECETLFGTLHADILTQMVCPEGFRYPEGAVVDSVCLFLYYSSWHGDGNTPLSISIYEMDGEVLDFNGTYSSEDSLSRFCSKKCCVVDKPRIIVASHPKDSIQNTSTGKYVPYFTFRLTDDFRDRFFSIKDFSSQERFNEQFKGLYITSEFGGATILHVPEISMAVYYHFEYQQKFDTTKIREIDVKGFYANTEVRQINRYELINTQLDILEALEDEVDFVVSPAYIFTRLRIPMKQMAESILRDLGDKRAYVNRARLDVEVINVLEEEANKYERDYWARPSTNMLLIKEDAIERFFTTNELPSDSCALLEAITSRTDSLEETHYYYSYDLSKLLTQQLRNKDNAKALPDTLDMVLVPVDVTTTTVSSSTTTITAVKHKQTISATAIRSANIEDDPMRLEVVYSGF